MKGTWQATHNCLQLLWSPAEQESSACWPLQLVQQAVRCSLWTAERATALSRGGWNKQVWTEIDDKSFGPYKNRWLQYCCTQEDAKPCFLSRWRLAGCFFTFPVSNSTLNPEAVHSIEHIQSNKNSHTARRERRRERRLTKERNSKWAKAGTPSASSSTKNNTSITQLHGDSKRKPVCLTQHSGSTNANTHTFPLGELESNRDFKQEFMVHGNLLSKSNFPPIPSELLISNFLFLLWRAPVQLRSVTKSLFTLILFLASK